MTESPRPLTFDEKGQLLRLCDQGRVPMESYNALANKRWNPSAIMAMLGHASYQGASGREIDVKPMVDTTNTVVQVQAEHRLAPKPGEGPRPLFNLGLGSLGRGPGQMGPPVAGDLPARSPVNVLDGFYKEPTPKQVRFQENNEAFEEAMRRFFHPSSPAKPLPGQDAARAQSVTPKTEAKNPYENPKDRVAKERARISYVPASFLVQVGLAMRDGARKYGAYNWRDSEVFASVYIDAAYRHLMAWYDGEDCAPDSGVHHLAHAAASLAVLLDAIHVGTANDDRPTSAADETRELLDDVAKGRVTGGL